MKPVCFFVRLKKDKSEKKHFESSIFKGSRFLSSGGEKKTFNLRTSNNAVATVTQPPP